MSLNGKTECVQLLLHHSVNIDHAGCQHSIARCLLQWAPKGEFVELLVECNANRNVQSGYGEPSLMCAEKAGLDW